MQQKQRIAMQRALAREALGKLRAAEELFGIEESVMPNDDQGFDEFTARVDEFEVWLFDVSSIA